MGDLAHRVLQRQRRLRRQRRQQLVHDPVEQRLPAQVAGEGEDRQQEREERQEDVVGHPRRLGTHAVVLHPLADVGRQLVKAAPGLHRGRCGSALPLLFHRLRAAYQPVAAARRGGRIAA